MVGTILTITLGDIARDTDQRYRHQPGSGDCTLRRADDVDYLAIEAIAPGTVIYAVGDGLVYVDAGRAADHYLFKGMLGLPFGIADPNFKIQVTTFRALGGGDVPGLLAMIIFLPQRFAVMACWSVR